jgi:hypothetical protein
VTLKDLAEPNRAAELSLLKKQALEVKANEATKAKLVAANEAKVREKELEVEKLVMQESLNSGRYGTEARNYNRLTTLHYMTSSKHHS